MQSRIDKWGGEKERLWESVKNAEKRESMVVKARHPAAKGDKKPPSSAADAGGKTNSSVRDDFEPVRPTKSKPSRELARLEASLATLAALREKLKREMDVVLWREKLIELAARRAEGQEECGWDQRVCFGDEEWEEFGEGVLESYEEGAGEGDKDEQEREREPKISGIGVADGEWWCTGKKKCDRHAGYVLALPRLVETRLTNVSPCSVVVFRWQKLRSAEVQFEKEAKEAAIAKLTTQERELRRKIEDVLDPSRASTAATTNTNSTMTNGNTPPLQSLNGKSSSMEANGHSMAARANSSPKVNGSDQAKKGKKKKN